MVLCNERSNEGYRCEMGVPIFVVTNVFVSVAKATAIFVFVMIIMMILIIFHGRCVNPM